VMTSRDRTSGGSFEAAADAVVSGDAVALQAMVASSPGLPVARSPRDHGAMLIHYVAANGVEDERQRTPPNAVDIAETLIKGGAEMNATFLDGASGTTPLVSLVTSIHPHRAGVASDLVEAFVAAGAKVNGLNDDGEPLRLALEFGFLESAEALVRCGAEVSTIAQAAGLGRIDLVTASLEGGGLPRTDVDAAFALACRYGWTAVAEVLLDEGVDIDAQGPSGFTGLMWAVRFGRLDTIKLLLDRGASMDITNDYGGTAFGVGMHFLQHAPEPGVDYAATIDALFSAGHRPPRGVAATGQMMVDAVLATHGFLRQGPAPTAHAMFAAIWRREADSVRAMLNDRPDLVDAWLTGNSWSEFAGMEVWDSRGYEAPRGLDPLAYATVLGAAECVRC